MYIIPDVQFSRRKRVHCVFGENDELLHTAGKIEQSIRYVIDQGETDLLMIGETDNVLIILRPVKK